MGGACAIAVDDGRQSLHVGPEHLGHGLLLGLAQLRELLGDVRHRAMVLADLHTVNRTTDLGGGCDVAGFGQRPGDALGSGLDFLVGVYERFGFTLERRFTVDTGQTKAWPGAVLRMEI